MWKNLLEIDQSDRIDSNSNWVLAFLPHPISRLDFDVSFWKTQITENLETILYLFYYTRLKNKQK